ncbi:DUF7537 family lipoprotein [Halosimplex salinum]|uniref:DUF7537 family lipoprotein n=1 Tax=Halosimplex salinum TaxID=1710538 RepID=UPI0013DE52F5|nr:hypothetical protein [Halosimplex salinum]
MDRSIGTLVVVALVVLSGCTMIGGDTSTATPDATPTADGTATATETVASTPTPWSTATEEPTPTETPAATGTPTATPTPTATVEPTPVGDLDPVSELSSLPPGVEGGSVTNVTALAQANQRQLLTGGTDLTMTIENSSREGTGHLRIANDTESSLVHLTEAEGALGTSTDLSTYYDAEESGVYNRSSGEVIYGHGPTTSRFTARFVTGLVYVVPQAYASAPDWETAGSYTTDAGEERLVLQADSVREDAGDQSLGGDVSDDDEEIRSVEARMEVTADGLVRELSLAVELDPASGESYTQTVSYTVADLGAGALDRPDWLSDAPQLRASTTADDELLVVEHTGGPTIEAGTNLTVGGGFSSIGNVSADQPITEGDTLYVHATGESFDRTPHLSVNERPTLPENVTAFSGQIGLSGTQGNTQFEAAVEIASDATEAAALVRP